MADDHIIRIILEGKDKLSNVFGGAAKKMDADMENIRKSINKLRKDVDNAQESLSFGTARVGRTTGPRGRFINLDRAEDDIKRLSQALDELKAKRDSLGASGRARDFLKGFREATQEAKDIGQQIETQLSTEREAIKERRRLLDLETREEQNRLNETKRKRKEDVLEQVREKQEEFIKEQNNLKKIQDDAIEKEVKLSQQRQKLRRQEKIDRDAEIKKSAAEALIPISLAKKGEKDEDVLVDLAKKSLQIRAERDKSLKESTATLNLQIAQENKLLNAKKRANVEARKSAEREHRLELDDFRRTENAKVTELNRTEQVEFTRQQKEKRASLLTPDAASVRQGILQERAINDEARKGDVTFQRFGRTIGRWAGDFRRGASEGKRGLVDFSSEAQKAESRMTRLGQRAGRLAGQFGNLVNIRWFLLTTALQTVGTIVVQLGTSFVALASSATFAATAVASAFAAAASQALPVVGLLQASLLRVQDVLKAVKLQNQNKVATASESTAQLSAQREETERLADAQNDLAQAILSVGDAQFDAKQASLDVIDALKANKTAIKNLAEARIEASRGIVDAHFRERDANISLRDSELAVIQAKRDLLQILKEQRNNQADIEAAKGAVREAQQRLEVAKREKDTAEIADATAQLAVAQQSLSQISIDAQDTNLEVKQAKNDIKSAVLDRDRAKVEKKRAREDAAKADREQVNNNERVVSAKKAVDDSERSITVARHQQVLATRQVANALHAVQIAQREIRDLEQDRSRGLTGQIAGERQLKALLDQLSPDERKLFTALSRVQDIYKKQFTPITDIIVRAITRAVDRSVVLLRDPKLLNAATNLATSIAAGLDRLSKFTISPQFRKDLEFFINQAAKNMPLVVDALINLVKSFNSLARIGAPLFRRFLEFIDKSTQSLEKFLGNKEKTDVFFGIAGEHLDAWIDLGEAIGRIIVLLIKGSQASGKGLLIDLTNFLNGLADWMQSHPKAVEDFFERMANNTRKIASALKDLIPVLAKAFTTDDAADFIVFVTKVVIPGIGLFIQSLQLLSQVLLGLSNIPFVGQFILLFSQFLVAEKLLNRVFPITQKLTDGFKLLFKVIGGAILTKSFAGFAEAFPKLAKGIRLVGTALRFVFITNPWIAVIAGIVAAIIILDRKFHFLKPTIEALRKAFEATFNWVKDHWKLLVGILTGPFGQVAYVIYRWHNQIIGFFQDIIDWVKDHWRGLAEILVAIFVPGGAIAVAIFKWRNQIIGFFQSIIDWIRDHWKGIVEILVAAFVPGGAIIVAFIRWHDRVIALFNSIITWVKGHWKALAAVLVSIFVPGGIAVVAVIRWRDQIIGLFRSILDWASDHWKNLATSLVTAFVPGGRTLTTFLKWRNSIIGFFQDIIDWVKQNWKNLVETLILAFLPGGAAIVAFLKWHDKLIKFFDNTVKDIAKTFKKLPDLVIDAIKDLPKRIVDLFENVGPEITKKIVEQIPGGKEALTAGGFLKKGAGKAASAFKSIFRAGGGLVPGAAAGGPIPGSPQGSDTVPAWLTPGEWVINRKQQAKLASALGVKNTSAIAEFLFGKATNEAAAGFGSKNLGYEKPPGNNLPGYDRFQGPNFQLYPHQDTDGKVVWFIEFKDKTFGQVSRRDAEKILSSGGTYLPGYVRQHGPTLPGIAKKMKKTLSNDSVRNIKMGIANKVGFYNEGGPVGDVSFAAPVFISSSGDVTGPISGSGGGDTGVTVLGDNIYSKPGPVNNFIVSGTPASNKTFTTTDPGTVGKSTDKSSSTSKYGLIDKSSLLNSASSFSNLGFIDKSRISSNRDSTNKFGIINRFNILPVNSSNNLNLIDKLTNLNNRYQAVDNSRSLRQPNSSSESRTFNKVEFTDNSGLTKKMKSIKLSILGKIGFGDKTKPSGKSSVANSLRVIHNLESPRLGSTSDSSFSLLNKLNSAKFSLLNRLGITDNSKAIDKTNVVNPLTTFGITNNFSTPNNYGFIDNSSIDKKSNFTDAFRSDNQFELSDKSNFIGKLSSIKNNLLNKIGIGDKTSSSRSDSFSKTNVSRVELVDKSGITNKFGLTNESRNKSDSFSKSNVINKFELIDKSKTLSDKINSVGDKSSLSVKLNSIDKSKLLNKLGLLDESSSTDNIDLSSTNIKKVKSGINHMVQKAIDFKASYGLGGSATPQYLAGGGIVLNSPAGSRGGNNVTQNFSVKTEGEQDWNYVMRLSAIHAQEAY